MPQHRKLGHSQTNDVALDMLHRSACGEEGLMAFTPKGIVVDGNLDTPEFRAFLEENGITITHTEERMCG